MTNQMLARSKLQLRKRIPPVFGRIDRRVTQSVPLLATGGGRVVALGAAAVATSATDTAETGLSSLISLGSRTKPKRNWISFGPQGSQRIKADLHPVRTAHALNALSTDSTALDNLSPGAADSAGLVGLLRRVSAGAGRSPTLLLLVVLVLVFTALLAGSLSDSLSVLLLLQSQKANCQRSAAKDTGELGSSLRICRRSSRRHSRTGSPRGQRDP